MIEASVAKLAILVTVLAATLTLLSGVAMAGAAAGPATFGAADPAVIKCQLMVEMHEASVTGTERQFFGYAQGYSTARRIPKRRSAMPSSRCGLRCRRQHPDANGAG